MPKKPLLYGNVIAHPKGYGFFHPDNGDEDLFLSRRTMQSLFHGDRITVAVRPVKDKKRLKRNDKANKVATLVEILERVNDTLVGRYHYKDGVGYMIADDPRLHQPVFIDNKDRKNAKDGQYIRVKITKQPGQHNLPYGKVTHIIGNCLDEDTAVDLAIHNYDLPFIWEQELAEELTQIPEYIDAKEHPDRTDLREMPFVTIDGEDAHDFDDALYCEKIPTGSRLYVAIADVSYYVTENSVLDTTAWTRGTSVYFPRRVLPMLPEKLSNNLCSLRPDEDRLSVVCILDFDHHGKRIDYYFRRALIRSHARLTYTQVHAMVAEREPDLCDNYKHLIAMLDDLYALFHKLRAHRQSHALIEFSTTEVNFLFDQDHKISHLVKIHRNDAHRLVEECMLAANVAAGEYLQQHKIPFLYRVHPPPEEESVQDIRSFLSGCNLQLGGKEKPDTTDYAHLITQLQGREDAHLIELLLLRSMSLAVYTTENIGHFGLGFPVYTHFTSPIRRYPDLLVHRAICHLLSNGTIENFQHDKKFMHAAAEQCSMAERRAESAVRDVEKRLKCLYLQRHIGDEFDGHISSVTPFGVFVEIDSLYIEGLLHITALPEDYYHHDPIRHCLCGESTKNTFRLTDAIRVRVARVSVEERKIDFDQLH